ncbi:hypothetical protein E2C01_001218 [Portunus trituberculatus]|uniref:Uncharacterized protein n=1 Tax=Portunus trituberculatus TaxID=210409 RepID=A0A5B7CHF0_PORTR|nr:hypothetical protein [Portunus trituberculatus]
MLTTARPKNRCEEEIFSSLCSHSFHPPPTLFPLVHYSYPSSSSSSSSFSSSSSSSSSLRVHSSAVCLAQE